jgi:hypothetical protein
MAALTALAEAKGSGQEEGRYAVVLSDLLTVSLGRPCFLMDSCAVFIWDARGLNSAARRGAARRLMTIHKVFLPCYYQESRLYPNISAETCGADFDKFCVPTGGRHERRNHRRLEERLPSLCLTADARVTGMRSTACIA